MGCWTVNLKEWGAIKKWLPGAAGQFMLAWDIYLPEDVVSSEESWMRSQGWRACILFGPLTVAATCRVGDKHADGTQQWHRMRHVCSGAAARFGNALLKAEASICARSACLLSITAALFQAEHCSCRGLCTEGHHTGKLAVAQFRWAMADFSGNAVHQRRRFSGQTNVSGG